MDEWNINHNWPCQNTDEDERKWLFNTFGDPLDLSLLDWSQDYILELSNNDASNNFLDNNASANLNTSTNLNVSSDFNASTNLNASSDFNASTNLNASSDFNASTNLNVSSDFNASTNLNASSVINPFLKMSYNQGGATKQYRKTTEVTKVKKPRKSEKDQIPLEERIEAKRLLSEFPLKNRQVIDGKEVTAASLSHPDLLSIAEVIKYHYNSTVTNPALFLSLTGKPRRALVYLRKWFLDNIDKIRCYLNVLTIECVQPKKATRPR